MPICPRCHHQIEATDLACTYCQLPLKAHGHPGIELHQATSEASLCLTCTYHQDDTCTFPQRPHAQTCTLYQSLSAEIERAVGIESARASSFAVRPFWYRYRIWIILVGLFGISLLLTLF